MDSDIRITATQKIYLQMLLNSDLKRMTDLYDHAIAHQTEIFIPQFDTCAQLVAKLNGES